MNQELEYKGKQAKQASKALMCAGTDIKNTALGNMAQALQEQMEEILAANQMDLEAAKEKGISGALLDRLTLTPERIAAMRRVFCK